MKISRDKAIARLEDRIAQRQTAAAKAAEAVEGQFFSRIGREIQRHGAAMKAYQKAAEKSSAREALKVLQKSDAEMLQTHTIERFLSARPDHTTIEMQQTLELLKLSDDETIAVRTNSELHAFLVG